MKRYSLKLKIILILILFFGLFGLAKSPWAANANWYVSKSCLSSCDGTTWEKGWSELDQIVWGSSGVMPGDTVWIDGGPSGLTYVTGIRPGVDKTNNSRIYIRPGAAHPTLSVGHDGLVTITVTSAGNSFGIGAVILKNYITLDGMVANTRKIRVTGSLLNSGVWLGNGAVGVRFNGVEVDHNPIAALGNSAAEVGIRVTGDSGVPGGTLQVEISNCSLHDNYTYQIAVLGGNAASLVYGSYSVHDNIVYNHPGEDMIYADADGYI